MIRAASLAAALTPRGRFLLLTPAIRKPSGLCRQHGMGRLRGSCEDSEAAPGSCEEEPPRRPRCAKQHRRRSDSQASFLGAAEKSLVLSIRSGAKRALAQGISGRGGRTRRRLPPLALFSSAASVNWMAHRCRPVLKMMSGAEEETRRWWS